jgi:hypothetical protein
MFQDYAALLGIISSILSMVALIVLIPRKGPKPPLKDPITYALLTLNLIVTALLPLQLYGEFPQVSSDAPRYAPYLFYFRHYPHIVIFPVLLFGLAVLFIFRALDIWRDVVAAKLRWRIVFAFALATLVTYWEASGRQMMLLEFNPSAQSATELFSHAEVRERAATLGLANAFAPSPSLGQQVMTNVNNGLSPPKAATQRMDELLNHYEAWNKLGPAWASKSRTCYLAVFFYMMFVMFLGFSLSVFLPRTADPESAQQARDAHISLNLLCAFFVFLLWVPFRIFYNVDTKIPLFGPDNIWDNFFGKIPLTSIFGFTPADILPVAATISFTIILLVRIRRISKKQTVVLVAIAAALLVVGSAVMARLNREAFLQITGVDQDLKYIAFRVVFAFVVTLLLYQFIESIPPKAARNGPAGNGAT